MTRRLLKQRYMASLHGKQGHAYRVYISKQTVDDLQTIYEHNPLAFSDDMRVQDMASLFIENKAAGEAWYIQSVRTYPRIIPSFDADVPYRNEPDADE